MSDTNNKFQNKYRIPSTRAEWHDYNGGTYFITICTAGREHYFGEIAHTDGKPQMILSEIGKCVSENLQNITAHYPYAEIPLFVVMPNHLHAIVIIDGNKTPYERVNNCTNVAHCRDAARHVSTEKSKKMRQIANLQGWLSVVIGGIKSAVTKFAHQNNIPFAWQTRFHDHIIRDQNEMNCSAEYIENNVAKWDLDELNTL